MRIREINDKWRHEIEKLETDKDDLERKIRDLEDHLAQVGRGNDKQEGDLAELRRKHEVSLGDYEIAKTKDHSRRSWRS